MESGRDYEHPRGRIKTAIKNSKELAGGGAKDDLKGQRELGLEGAPGAC